MYLSKPTFFKAAIVLFVAASLFSCKTPKNITYFRDLPDSGALKSVQLPEYKAPLIQPDDILQVSIETIDPLVTATVNQAAPSGGSSGSSASPSTLQQSGAGYLVSKEGYIDLALIGRFKVVGLNTAEAGVLIQQKASEILKSPTVQVRFLNYKVTVLGEVNRPATYTLPNERVTVLDAIGLAGDLTIFGQRENILVIHDVDGKKEFERLNLTKTDFFKSPSFYLRQNDVVYVEPNKAKKSTNNAQDTKTITIIVSIASVIALILVRFK